MVTIWHIAVMRSMLLVFVKYSDVLLLDLMSYSEGLLSFSERVPRAVEPSIAYVILRSAPHSVFMCFVWISEQTAIISLYNIN
jgi:hypothetical protein